MTFFAVVATFPHQRKFFVNYMDTWMLHEIEANHDKGVDLKFVSIS